MVKANLQTHSAMVKSNKDRNHTDLSIQPWAMPPMVSHRLRGCQGSEASHMHSMFPLHLTIYNHLCIYPSMYPSIDHLIDWPLYILTDLRCIKILHRSHLQLISSPTAGWPAILTHGHGQVYLDFCSPLSVATHEKISSWLMNDSQPSLNHHSPWSTILNHHEHHITINQQFIDLDQSSTVHEALVIDQLLITQPSVNHQPIIP